MLLRTLADILFPRNCAGCGAPAGETARYFCWDCLAGLEIIRPPFCRICGDPGAGALEGDYVCGACLDQRPAFDLARSAIRYRGPLENALQEFKYNGATWLSRDFGLLLAACHQAHYAGLPIDAILNVPLFPTKERQRAYNQAGLLARELGHRLGRPLVQFLVKRRPTPTQTHLTAADRRANVRDSFAIKKGAAVRGRQVLLIDDVMTTGATAGECARMLKEAGAAGVYVLTLARG
jgi:ComF family protein